MPKCDHKTSEVISVQDKKTICRCTWDCQQLFVSIERDDGISRIAEYVPRGDDKTLDTQS